MSLDAKVDLLEFDEMEQLQIVKEVDQLNRQAEFCKDEDGLILSNRIIHFCKLKAAKVKK